MRLTSWGPGDSRGGPPSCEPPSAATSAADRAGAFGRYISVMVRVMLRAVRVDLQTNTPVLLLQETDGEGRTLPIFIGNPEATAIAYAIQGVEMPRPLTHDLMKDMLSALEIKVEQVLITELRSSTYFAELHLSRGEGRTVVSSRPSDAVAVAVRTETPIFVADELMESEGIILALESDEETDEEVPEELVGGVRQFC